MVCGVKVGVVFAVNTQHEGRHVGLLFSNQTPERETAFSIKENFVLIPKSQTSGRLCRLFPERGLEGGRLLQSCSQQTLVPSRARWHGASLQSLAAGRVTGEAELISTQRP